MDTEKYKDKDNKRKILISKIEGWLHMPIQWMVRGGFMEYFWSILDYGRNERIITKAEADNYGSRFSDRLYYYETINRG